MRLLAWGTHLKPGIPTCCRLLRKALAGVVGGLVGVLFPSLGAAQDLPYLKTKTTHTFAQLYLGLDVVAHRESILIVDASGATRRISAPSQGRLIIGGLHFWGRADIYVAFPIRRTAGDEQNLQIDYSSGVETGFRWHPLRISPGLLPSPFLGLAWNVRKYQQTTAHSRGPDYTQHSISQQIGFTWAGGGGLWEAGYMRFPRSKRRITYPISRTQQAQVSLPSSSLWLGWRWVKDTTNRGGAPSAGLGRSSSALTLGLGPSVAFLLSDSPHVEKHTPYLERRPTALFLEYTLGAYLGGFDAGVWVAGRKIKTERKAYDRTLIARRRVHSLEVFPFLLNWHGFVPFIGPSLGIETLSIRELEGGREVARAEKRMISAGVLFGWDIRPKENASYILRTALRYVPNLYITHPTTKERIYFDAVEFNFIQFVWHFR